MAGLQTEARVCIKCLAKYLVLSRDTVEPSHEAELADLNGGCVSGTAWHVGAIHKQAPLNPADRLAQNAGDGPAAKRRFKASPRTHTLGLMRKLEMQRRIMMRLVND